MGGFGSGRRRRGARPEVVEDCLVIRIGDVVRSWLLHQGSGERVCEWHLPGRADRPSMRITRDHNGLHFRYVADAADGSAKRISLPVGLMPHTLHHGGTRWFWMCPACRRQAASLYLPPGQQVFACRRCHGLSYSCRQASRWLPRQIQRRMDRVRRLRGHGLVRARGGL